MSRYNGKSVESVLAIPIKDAGFTLRTSRRINFVGFEPT